MPKQVDPAAQRLSIANAAIAVIDRDGLDGARLRDVARAAQVTTGAVTHYFDNKDAVLEAALAEVVRRILEKQAEPPPSWTYPDAIVDQACMFLPLDDDLQRDWRVWLAFWGRAVFDERLRAIHRGYYDEIVGRVAVLLTTRSGGRIDSAQGRDLADAIIAAVDGVGVRATFEVELWPADRQRRTLSALLRPLLAPHFDTRTA